MHIRPNPAIRYFPEPDTPIDPKRCNPEHNSISLKIEVGQGHILPLIIPIDHIIYNRCHLIGYQLTTENENERDLITGTRYLNIAGMLPFENQVADYVQQTGNHVLYRVTPVFEGDNLLASSVLMEAYSVEDSGTGICFCVYAFNVQPGVQIDYATGESALADEAPPEPTKQVSPEEAPSYVLNHNTRKFHRPSCSSVEDIKPSNRENYSGSREALIEQGYVPCKRCRP